MTQKLASMTGYARSTSSHAGANIQCEIKTVNGRGMDVRLRLANGLDALEPKLRRRFAEYLTRGSINCTISVQNSAAGAELGVNEQALDAILRAIEDVSGRVDATKPTLDGILGLKGVLETREQPMSEQDNAQLHAAILVTVEQCLTDLVSARQSEGNELVSIINRRLDKIEQLTAQAENHPGRTREAFIERLRTQIADLSEANSALSEERLHQEALLLATKADIREELDRLVTHVRAARKLIADGGPIGRKLDFLAQEFNREANTLCSKSHAVELTAIGLDLKAEIDQLREQVQNLE